MSTWSKEHIATFINLYRSHECLWRIKAKEYSNKLHRERAYRDLIAFVRTFESQADKNVVVKKICNLRNCYRKEAKKIDSSKVSDSGVETVYEPKLWYFPLLDFLRDQETGQGASCSNLSSAEELSQYVTETKSEALDFEESLSTADAQELDMAVEEPDLEEDVQSTASSPSDPSTPPRFITASNRLSTTQPIVSSYGRLLKAKRKATGNAADEQRLLLARNRLESTPADDDESAIFGKNVACKLRRITLEQRVHAEKLINDVLYYAQLESLNTASHIASQSLHRIKLK